MADPHPVPLDTQSTPTKLTRVKGTHVTHLNAALGSDGKVLSLEVVEGRAMDNHDDVVFDRELSKEPDCETIEQDYSDDEDCYDDSLPIEDQLAMSESEYLDEEHSGSDQSVTQFDEDHAEYDTDSDEERSTPSDPDPFSSSEALDSAEAMDTIDPDRPLRSIEPPNLFVAQTQGERNFSAATAIRRKEHAIKLEESKNGAENNISQSKGHLDVVAQDGTMDSRSVSNISSMPYDDADIEYYRSSLPHRNAKHTHRAGYQQIQSSPGLYRSPEPTASRDPRNTSTPTPQRQPSRIIMPSPSYSRSNSAVPRSGGRPAFRNASSVKAMQMSSPSPPPEAFRRGRMHTAEPFSASPLRREREPQWYASPTYHTPPLAPHPDVRKEHPLVLLHCTLHTSMMPRVRNKTKMTEAGIPDDVANDIFLLQEKLSTKVLERGILISHPGEDYELLEERILESLELQQPRVGSCGHFFRGVHDESSSCPSEEEREDNENDATAREDGAESVKHTKHDVRSQDGRKMCLTCAKPISHHLTHSNTTDHNSDRGKRWDVRVYASNGLMRAGAWGAAWREMEKVDVEVEVWMNETIRRQLDDLLDQSSKEQDKSNTSNANARAQSVAERGVSLSPEPDLAHGIQSQRSYASLGDKSVDSVSQSESHEQPSEGTRSASSRGHRSLSMDSINKPGQSVRGDYEQLPLSVLLQNYLSRQMQSYKDFLLPVSIIILGMILVGQSIFSNAATSPANNKMQHHNIQTSIARESPTPDPVTGLELQTNMENIPVCTFAASEADKHGMIAVSKAFAEHAIAAHTPDENEQADAIVATSTIDVGVEDAETDSVTSSLAFEQDTGSDTMFEREQAEADVVHSTEEIAL